MAPEQWIDTHTPSVSVADSRGLAVRNVAYCRHPLTPSVDARITRNHFDAAGRLVASWDPRLWGTAPRPNLATTHDLQSKPLLVDSVDAGWQLSLLDQAGMARSYWDARGSQRRTEYDQLQRPITVTEQMKDGLPPITERFAYAQAGDEFAVHNQCGQLIRHDHPAGSRSHCEYGVGGLLLAEETRFLLDLASPDWSSESTGAILEDEVFRTTQQYGASGEMLCQTDARDNFRAFAYNQAGELQEIRLRLAGASGPPQVLVGDIRYDAHGKVEHERAANGVVSTARYAAEDGRLAGLLSCDTRGTPLQHFEYAYDPVGNISSVEDKVAVTRYFNQRRIEPINRYRYDSLYQLVEATGREVSQPGHGPALPAWQTTPLDPNQLRNYTQTFNYDAAGNLQTRHHSGVETFEMFTSPGSNRSVADEGSLVDGFDANGNQRELLRGQEMNWDIRNQLSRVTMVRREDGSDDTECYFYDSPGHRLRKVRLTETACRTLRAEVRYLPGLEIHRDTATGEERQVLGVEAGLSHVRALHWVGKLPKGVRNDQLRFCLNDHLNSCTLELDELGALLSREVYYPFGGTALWAGTSEIEAKYKTIRYSGKERDATGLYYYGYRYYAPWLQRWVSADPAGEVDGLNLFLMLFNNPVNWMDTEGQNAVPTIAHFFWAGRNIDAHYLGNMLIFKRFNPSYQIKVWTDKPSHILNTLSVMESGDDPIDRGLAKHHGHHLEINDPDEMFKDLATTFPDAHKVQSIFQRESNGPYRNLAAASDIFRMAALHFYGGLYMDVDVATRGEIDSINAPEGFLAHVYDDSLVGNFVLAATPGSLHSSSFLKKMIDHYRLEEEVGWVTKRTEEKSRERLTSDWTGPGLIMSAVVNPTLSVEIQDFGSRVPYQPGQKLIQSDYEVNELLRRGHRVATADHDGGWTSVKPRRRASVA
jgi:insecticidal toxin complex protein TccC